MPTLSNKKQFHALLDLLSRKFGKFIYL